MRLSNYGVIFTVILLEIVLTQAEFECFRKFYKKRSLCKGPVRRKSKYNTPEKCCKKKGKGFAYGLVPHGKRRNKYRCMSCADIPGSTTEPPTTTPRAEWGEWSPCSQTCGAGWRSRYRMCEDCDKNHFENTQSQPCLVNFYCPVDGSWGPWFGWQPCSTSCGGGVRKRERRCNYPPPTHGGRVCPGEAEREQECNEDPCPVDGSWSEWSHYTLCSLTCGTGTMSRARRCDSPSPQNGGRQCPGPSRHTKRCQNRQCPLHGGWSLWGSWSNCPVTCGIGQQERTRACDSPRPLFGGRPCEGSGTDSKDCQGGRPCPIHGGWTTWVNGRCQAARCERGIRMRSRSCTNPRPRHGGNHCLGQHYERTECINDENCPVQANWCSWNEWSSCTATCTGLNSMQVRQRSCMCPAAAAGGQDCEGENFQVRECEGVPSCHPYAKFLPERTEEGLIQTKDEENLTTTAESSGDGSKVTGDQEEDSEKVGQDTPQTFIN